MYHRCKFVRQVGGSKMKYERNGTYQNLALLGGKHVTLAAHDVAVAHVDDTLLELSGHTESAEMGLHGVRELGQGTFLQSDVLGGLESRARVISLSVTLEPLQNLIGLLVGHEKTGRTSNFLFYAIQVSNKG